MFYAMGSSLLNKFIKKYMAPNQIQRLQLIFRYDISLRSYEKWKYDKDIIATKNMNEDEVLEFYKTKYILPGVNQELKD